MTEKDLECIALGILVFSVCFILPKIMDKMADETFESEEEYKGDKL